MSPEWKKKHMLILLGSGLLVPFTCWSLIWVGITFSVNQNCCLAQLQAVGRLLNSTGVGCNLRHCSHCQYVAWPQGLSVRQTADWKEHSQQALRTKKCQVCLLHPAQSFNIIQADFAPSGDSWRHTTHPGHVTQSNYAPDGLQHSTHIISDTVNSKSCFRSPETNAQERCKSKHHIAPDQPVPCGPVLSCSMELGLLYFAVCIQP